MCALLIIIGDAFMASMDSFILPARVREARNLAFSSKIPFTLIKQLQQPKVVVGRDQVGVKSLVQPHVIPHLHPVRAGGTGFGMANGLS